MVYNIVGASCVDIRSRTLGTTQGRLTTLGSHQPFVEKQFFYTIKSDKLTKLFYDYKTNF